MRIPNGFHADSIRIPNASRAGALYATPRYATPRHLHVVGHFAFPTYEGATCEAPAPSPDRRQEAMR